MTIIYKDRVSDASASEGLDDFVLTGAQTGYQGAVAAIGDTNQFYYMARNTDVPAEWEVGLGTLSSGTLTRDTILDSSNSAAKVDFSTGSKSIVGVLPASIISGFATGTLPPGHLYGLTLSNNVTDATNDIDIAAGSCRDSTDAVNIVGTAMTKQLDANWAAGSAAGFRNSGAAITDTTYHIYAVCKAAGADPDYYAHTSTTVATVITALQAETGGASYLYARRIGSIVRTGAAIKPFLQTGDRFEWKTPVQDVNSAANTAVTARTLTVPLGLKVEAEIMVLALGTMNSNLFVGDPDLGSIAASGTNRTLYADANLTTGASVRMRCLTNTSAQVNTDGDGGASTVTISTFGYIDSRGRLA